MSSSAPSSRAREHLRATSLARLRADASEGQQQHQQHQQGRRRQRYRYHYGFGGPKDDDGDDDDDLARPLLGPMDAGPADRPAASEPSRAAGAAAVAGAAARAVAAAGAGAAAAAAAAAEAGQRLRAQLDVLLEQKRRAQALFPVVEGGAQAHAKTIIDVKIAELKRQVLGLVADV